MLQKLYSLPAKEIPFLRGHGMLCRPALDPYNTFEWKSDAPRVKKDLSKVSFGLNNFYYKGDELGYQTLSNGLSCLLMRAGGYQEWPICFIIYFDGMNLRGYIPKDGNPWNTDTKQAFGNNRIADHKNARKRWRNCLYDYGDKMDDNGFYIDNLDVVTSYGLIIKDIMKNIVVR